MIRLEPLRWWHLPGVMAIELEAFSPDDWSVETWWGELAAGSQRHLVAAVDDALLPPGGKVAGFAGLAIGPEGGHVMTIAVATDRRGERLGARLLADLLAAALAARCRQVRLEVRADDPVAQNLYARAGFITEGRRRHYYEATGEDALVMRCDDLAGGIAALA